MGTSTSESDPRSVQNELIMLSLPAIAGQAIEPLAQLMETAYIGKMGNAYPLLCIYYLVCWLIRTSVGA